MLIADAGTESKNRKIGSERKAWYNVDPSPLRNRKGKMAIIIRCSLYAPLSFQSQNIIGTKKNNEE